jgi:hypothetical protein
MRSGGALAGGGPDGVGVKVGEGVTVGEGMTVGVEVGVEVGEDVAVGVGDMVLEVGETVAVEACTELVLSRACPESCRRVEGLSRSVGGTAVGIGVMVAVGGREVRVGGTGVAEGVGVTLPPPLSPP